MTKIFQEMSNNKAIFFLFAFGVLLIADVLAGGGHHHRRGRHVLPHIDRQQLLLEDSINERSKVGAARFAKRIPVNLNPDNSGETFFLPDGRKVWTVNIVSEGAYSLNLLFDKFRLAAGDTVFVYNAGANQVLTLTEENNPKSGRLPLVPLDGSELTVELRQATPDSSSNINISRVNHDYRGLKGLPNANNVVGNGDNCSPHASCVAEVSQIKQSVCVLIIDGTGYCTGTLVNNTARDGRPYVLTAAHCFDENYETAADMASTTVAYFNYEAPNCNSSIRGPMEFAIGAATLRAFAVDMDLALIEFLNKPPVDFRPYYAGWNRATSPSPPFRGIHHPYGTIKRVARRNALITNGTYPDSDFLPRSHWLVGSWNEGTTEKGSSGSGLFDANMRLIGALTGGASQCSNNDPDYYYRLNRAWKTYPEINRQLACWLDPLGTGATSLGGLNPYGTDSAFRHSNLSFHEAATMQRLPAPDRGLAAGQNSQQTTEYAEKYEFDRQMFLHGFYFVPAKADMSRINKVIFRIYAAGADDLEPVAENILSQFTVNLTAIEYANGRFSHTSKPQAVNNDHYVRLNAPLDVGTKFFISYQVPAISSSADSFAVYTAAGRALPDGRNTVFARRGSEWHEFPYFSGSNTSLWIDPVLRLHQDTGSNAELADVEKTLVFPNPVRGTLYVRLPGKRQNDRECSILIYNMAGALISSETVYALNEDIPIDVRHLQSGIYFLQIKYKNDEKETRKFIIGAKD